MKRTGFTLIELLIVIAVLGIIIAIVLPILPNEPMKITIIDKIQKDGKSILVYSIKDGEKLFAETKKDTEGIGIFYMLKIGGKYEVEINVYNSPSTITKITKTILEPIDIEDSTNSLGTTLDEYNARNKGD